MAVLAPGFRSILPGLLGNVFSTRQEEYWIGVKSFFYHKAVWAKRECSQKAYVYWISTPRAFRARPYCVSDMISDTRRPGITLREWEDMTACNGRADCISFIRSSRLPGVAV